MKKSINMFIMLSVRVKLYLATTGTLLFAILPCISVILSKSDNGNSDMAEEMALLYQLMAPLVLAIGLAVLLAPVVEEEGREILYLFEKWFIKQAIIFHILGSIALFISLKISSIFIPMLSDFNLILCIICFLFQGLVFMVLFLTKSSVFAIGSVFLYIIYSFTAPNALFGFVFSAQMDMKEFLNQMVYCCGLAITFWVLGAIKSYFPRW